MADISKIKINSGEALNIKDDIGRKNMATLLGSHGLTALGSAAWLNVVDEVTDGNLNPVTSNAVADAIAALGQALRFVGIATKQEGETEAQAVERAFPAASQTAGAVAICGAKEFICAGSPLVWNEFGDVSAYETQAHAEATFVKKSLTIAGIDLNDDVTAAELKTALGLGALAYKNSASGSITIVDSADDITVAKADTYTVAGTAVAVPATYSPLDVTPAGSVELTAGTAVSATYAKATSATISAVANENGNYQPSRSVNLPTYTSSVTPSKEAVATVTSAGTGYSITEGSVTKGTDSTSQFAETGMVAALDSVDTEMLVFTDASKAAAVISSGAPVYTAPVLSGALPTFGTKEVMVGATVATTADGAASFSGNKVQIGAELGYTDSAATVVQPTFTAAFSGTSKSVTPTVATTKNAAPADATITVASETKSITLNKTAKTVTVE